MIQDNQLRSVLSQCFPGWQEKDETMQDYIIQLFLEQVQVADDEDMLQQRDGETLQDFLRDNILPFIMEDVNEDDQVNGEDIVRQLTASLMKLHHQSQQKDDTTATDTAASIAPCENVPPPVLEQEEEGQKQQQQPFSMRAMLKEQEATTAQDNQRQQQVESHTNSDAAVAVVASTTDEPSAMIQNPKSKEEKLTTRQERRKQKLANKQQQKKKKKSKSPTTPKEDHESSRSAGAGATGQAAAINNGEEEEEFVEDDANAWEECKAEGRIWGGRGYGGRGEYAAAVNSVKSNIHLTNVTISLPNGAGQDLLQNATMDIQRGHVYGLVGRNGVGKSTLLHRLANYQIPGMPTDMRILLVQQQVQGSDTETPVQVLLQADTERTRLLQEQERLEKILDQAESSSSSSSSSASTTELNDKNDNKEKAAATMTLTEAAERWSDIEVELEAIEADKAEERGLEILRGLQFTPQMLTSPTSQLSGGWRMRLALAKSLFVPHVDLLLFDECTNHLDLAGLDWLTNHLNKNSSSNKKGSSNNNKRNEDRTLIVVSHDRTFLNAICTDIMHMEHQQLTYHPGNYADYERTQREKSTHHAQILDASERQRAKAQAFVQKQQQQANKKSADPNKQRQAKMIREKKMDRIGSYRPDGKRYKNFSLAKLDMDYIRVAEKVQIKVEEAVISMHFPNPTWPPGIAPGDDVVRMNNLSFDYTGSNRGKPLLNNITASLHRGSKVALVGKNGKGKSTLMKLIAGELELNENPSPSTTTTFLTSYGGDFWRHSNLRIGHVTQYSVEELEQAHAAKTVVEYAEETLRSGKASASIVAKADGNIRQYLGAFGLGGKHALQTIGKLSGGERMRLCFATVLAEEPHLLLLDESTNHVDIETLDSMSNALDAYEGSVLMVSHNQAFLSGFCKELWVVEDDGRLTVNHSDTASFDEIFSQYRTAVAAGDGQSMADRRRLKSSMAKKAKEQRSGARQNTALL